jgi:hypothetical protein
MANSWPFFSKIGLQNKRERLSIGHVTHLAPQKKNENS